MDTKKSLTSSEAANYLGVSRSSLVGWMKQGLIQGEATPGGHYRFSLYALDTFAQQRGMSVATPKNREQRQLRLLVIEDDPAFREFVRDAFEVFQDIQIQEATDGIQGALLLGTWNPDVIMLDIRMPNVNGIEFLRLLRKNPATNLLKIMVVSAQLNSDVRAELDSLGVKVALEKPIRLTTLVNELQNLLGASLQ